jgi:hypothetical protein
VIGVDWAAVVDDMNFAVTLGLVLAVSILWRAVFDEGGRHSRRRRGGDG